MALSQARPQVELAGGERLGNDVRWVSVSPAYYEAMRRRMKSALWGVPLMVAFAGASFYFVFGLGVLESPRIRLQLIFMGVTLAAFVILTPTMARRSQERLRHYRLGASNAGLSYEMPKDPLGTTDRPGRVPWRDACFDGNIILAGRRQLRVRTVPRGDWIFDAEELRKAILVHIPKDNLLTPGQLQMRMVGGWIWLVAVLVVAVMVWALVAMNIIPGKP
jgi:hypothetical protein